MKRLPQFPILLAAICLAVSTLIINAAMTDQIADCISENSGNDEALEECLSRFYLPASMDCDELLNVHRTILEEAKKHGNRTVRNCARASAKLCIISLAADCYSADVAARLVGGVAWEIGGTLGPIIADATVSGAADAAVSLGADSGYLATSVSTESSIGVDGPVAATTGSQVPIYYDREVVVSTPSDGNPTP